MKLAIVGPSAKMAWRNLWRHSRRTWLTLGAMIFSNVLLVFMIALQAGSYSMMIENSLRAYSGHIQIQAPHYQQEQKLRQVVPSAIALAQQSRTLLNNENIAARAVGFAMASSEERTFGIQVTGVEPRYEPLVSTIPGLVNKGRYLDKVDAQEIVIGSVLARNLKVAVGSEITLLGGGYDGSIAAAIVTVVGIFESGVTELDRSLAQIPLVAFQQTFAMGSNGHMVVVSAPNLDVVPQWKTELQQNLVDKNLEVLDWNELQPGLRQAIQADMSSAAFMYLVLVLLVAFSVMNTQLMSVLERTREFGIMMALGLKPSRLSWLVINETSMLAGLGFCIGVFFGFLLTLYLSYTGFSYPGMEEMASKFNMPVRIYPSLSLLSLSLGPGFVFLGSILAAVYPALRIHRIHLVSAMRAV
ncbi:ABC-type transport system, involved in lipoprotein release, permease component [Alteromonadaceae bacterium Bs31]|nr:ABC-type transport system, involved in lipoprotein release, permease component [Alteromonadaceae bacterium Bs31]